MTTWDTGIDRKEELSATASQSLVKRSRDFAAWTAVKVQEGTGATVSITVLGELGDDMRALCDVAEAAQRMERAISAATGEPYQEESPGHDEYDAAHLQLRGDLARLDKPTTEEVGSQ